ATRPTIRHPIIELKRGHLPYLFPEVFLRQRPGFDCIIGNPPWEKPHVEEHSWWGARFAGLRSGPQTERDQLLRRLKRTRPDLLDEYMSAVEAADNLRLALVNGPYSGIGRGHIDLYQAFCWRFWHLLRHGGHVGVVLP